MWPPLPAVKILLELHARLKTGQIRELSVFESSPFSCPHKGLTPMIYAFYLFNRDGIFLYSEEWNRTKPESNRNEEQKLLFGLLFSLKGFADKLSNKEGCVMHSYKTGAYKLHLFDTITGLKFVLTTDASVPDLRDNLKFIHSGIYIEHVCKNPCQAVGSPVTAPGFAVHLNKYVRSLPFFNTPPAAS